MEFVVPQQKIVGYLLTNPVKSGFFLPLGYSHDNWTRLRDEIMRIATSFPRVLRRRTPYGDEYEIVGEIRSPNGRVIKLRTGWMLRASAADVMFFVTAYPA